MLILNVYRAYEIISLILIKKTENDLDEIKSRTRIISDKLAQSEDALRDVLIDTNKNIVDAALGLARPKLEAEIESIESTLTILLDQIRHPTTLLDVTPLRNLLARLGRPETSTNDTANELSRMIAHFSRMILDELDKIDIIRHSAEAEIQKLLEDLGRLKVLISASEAELCTLGPSAEFKIEDVIQIHCETIS